MESTEANESILSTLTHRLESRANDYYCGSYLYALNGVVQTHLLQDLTLQRLNRKSQNVIDRATQRGSDWNNVLLNMLLHYIGDMNNRQCYSELALSFNAIALDKERDSIFNLETILIYMSGLLDTLPKDEFTDSIRKNGVIMANKYDLQPIPLSLWDKRGITGCKHPIIRLSQIANLYHSTDMLLNRVLNCRVRNDIISLLNVSASPQWCNYFGETKVRRIGVDKRDIIGINVVVPIIHAYGTLFDDDNMVLASTDLLELLPAEMNNIIGKWRDKGLTPRNACETQALIELRNEFCRLKRCHECSLATHMRSPSSIINTLPHFIDSL